MELTPAPHPLGSTAGDAVRAEDGDVSAFVCWTDARKADSKAIPEQFARAQYFCDLEVFDDGILVVHKERVFPTSERAQAWYHFAVWCLATMPADDINQCATPWGLS